MPDVPVPSIHVRFLGLELLLIEVLSDDITQLCRERPGIRWNNEQCAEEERNCRIRTRRRDP